MTQTLEMAAASHRISDIRIHSLSAPFGRAYWLALEPYTASTVVLVEVETDAGLIGIGEIHARPHSEIVRVLEEAFKPRLLGEDPVDTERLWQMMFRLTYTRDAARFADTDGHPIGESGKQSMMAAIGGVDIALWDLKAQIAGLPLYKLLGGQVASVPAYASGGYYGDDGGADIDGLLAEMTSYAERGYEAVKMKVGGLSIAEDVRRVSAVREALPDVKLMVDATCAWDVATAIEAARAFEPFEIDWLEEPVAWFDPVEALAQVAAATRIPIASGEQELHRWGCRNLVDRGGIRVMQFDCTRSGGVSEWLRIAAYAAAHNVQMAPHFDPKIHGHLVAAAPNGLIQEVTPDDPFWLELFVERPDVREGHIVLSDRPGLGLVLDREVLARYSSGGS